MLRLALIFFLLFMGFLLVLAIKSSKLTVRYSLVWFFSIIFMAIALLIPNFLDSLSAFFGFEVVSNMLFLFGFLILLSVTFSLSIIVSVQSDKIRMLIQEVSILKEKINVKKKKRK